MYRQHVLSPADRVFGQALQCNGIVILHFSAKERAFGYDRDQPSG
jgi:hypothetical protein